MGSSLVLGLRPSRSVPVLDNIGNRCGGFKGKGGHTCAVRFRHSSGDINNIGFHINNSNSNNNQYSDYNVKNMCVKLQ